MDQKCLEIEANSNNNTRKMQGKDHQVKIA